MREVIVADHQELYRAGVASLLANNGYPTILQFSDWTGLLAAVETSRESLLIVSTSLILDLGQLARRSREASCRILLVAEDYDSPLRYRSVGTAGIIYRSTSAPTFLETVQNVKNGDGVMLPADRTERLADSDARLPAKFTPIEIKIIRSLMKGMKNGVIAKSLQVDEHVVRGRLQKIYDKTGFSNRLELVMHFACPPVLRTDESAPFELYRDHLRKLP